MLERLNAEITIHHQVKHPNIAELLNCFYDENYIYLILELCSHGDLDRYLKEKQTLSESESMSSIHTCFFMKTIFSFSTTYYKTSC